MQNKDEAALIEQSLNGDHQAYGVLVDRYKNALYHHCFAIVRNEAVAEDIAQETFIAAYYKLRLYKPQYRLSTWLFKIATNKALTWLKKVRHEVAADDSVVAAIASHHAGPDKQAIYAELRSAVDRLQLKHKMVVSMYYWQGLSYADIAVALAVPIGSVRGWLNRAKKQLKKELS